MDRNTPKIPKLIAFAGLPGVGKTSLAKRLAQTSDATYLRIDTIEQALVRSTLKISTAEDAGYEAAYHVAKDNLLLGQDIVADSVNPIEITRTAWGNVAQKCDAQFIQVEVICSDVSEHRRRVETRLADIENHRLPTWEKVQNRTYHTWKTERIIIDTANKSTGEAHTELLEQIKSLA